jgi:hypothetical protein
MVGMGGPSAGSRLAGSIGSVGCGPESYARSLDIRLLRHILPFVFFGPPFEPGHSALALSLDLACCISCCGPYPGVVVHAEVR